MADVPGLPGRCYCVGRDFKEHLVRLREVFERFRQAGLKLKPSKCFLLRSKVPFLGHVISADGMSTDPDKIRAVEQWPTPSNVSGAVISQEQDGSESDRVCKWCAGQSRAPIQHYQERDACYGLRNQTLPPLPVWKTVYCQNRPQRTEVASEL